MDLQIIGDEHPSALVLGFGMYVSWSAEHSQIPLGEERSAAAPGNEQQ